MPKPEIERFEEKYIAIPESGCWLWTAALDGDGYGVFSAYENGKYRAHMKAHRWSYKNFKGEIPDGMQIDHLCRVRSCVNPNHLEAVTPRENVIRGVMPSTRKEYWASRKYCRNNLHEMTPDNVVYDSQNIRRCKACKDSNQIVFTRRRQERRNFARLAKAPK